MRTKKRSLNLMIIVSCLLSPLLITQVHAACSTTCALEADTNVPASVPVWLRADGGTPHQFNYTYNFAFNSNHTLQIMNTTLVDPLTGGRFTFKQWVVSGSVYSTNTTIKTPTMTQDYTSSSFNGPFRAQFEKQLQLSLAFVDASGQPVNPPTSVTLNSTVTLTYTSASVNQYSNQWFGAGRWTVTNATWEGLSEANLGLQTIDLTQHSTTASISLKAYPAAIKLIDSSNNPLSGAMVTATFLNGTSTTVTSDNQGVATLGRIPFELYTAHIVYQNHDQGSYSIDASANPVDTIQISTGGGGVSTPVVSAIVLITIFGLAVFLIALAIRVRKPPPPPMIG